MAHAQFATTHPQMLFAGRFLTCKLRVKDLKGSLLLCHFEIKHSYNRCYTTTINKTKAYI